MCFIDIDLNETTEFHIEKMVKAKKEHRCIECKQLIHKGEVYEVVTLKYRGDSIFSCKTCSSCKEVRDVFCCSWYYGMVWELIIENIQEADINLGCLDNLSKEAVNKFLIFYEKYLEENDHGTE
jgi:hypothetical protein